MKKGLKVLVIVSMLTVTGSAWASDISDEECYKRTLKAEMLVDSLHPHYEVFDSITSVDCRKVDVFYQNEARNIKHKDSVNTDTWAVTKKN